MNILLTGQCSLHWGRMEFGNIGNYYIIEPFVREIYKAFPKATIKTTFQMSTRFCQAEKIELLPMELYYGWKTNELDFVEKELSISTDYSSTKRLSKTTPFIDAVMWADLVIDFSGDIWGDNANFLGENRFLIGLLKNKIAKNLGKKVVMLAGSPGPFTDDYTKSIAKSVFESFDLVTTREPISLKLLENEGFNTSKTKSLACPAFLFEQQSGNKAKKLLLDEGLDKSSRNKPIVGFILCGWNFSVGPFDKWPRKDEDYLTFAKVIEYLSEELGLQVCLMSHSNGFDIPPAEFELKHGRDYPIIKQLQNVIEKRGIVKDVISLDGVYDTWETKTIIGSFDMLISGRVHAAVAGLSQNVPTVIIDYGHEPKAHKLKGFAAVVGVQDYLADPESLEELINVVRSCWISKDSYKTKLERKIPNVKQLARKNFELLKEILE